MTIALLGRGKPLMGFDMSSLMLHMPMREGLWSQRAIVDYGRFASSGSTSRRFSLILSRRASRAASPHAQVLVTRACDEVVGLSRCATGVVVDVLLPIRDLNRPTFGPFSEMGAIITLES